MNSHEINSGRYVGPVLCAADKTIILNLCKIILMGLIWNYRCLLVLRGFIYSNLLLEGMEHLLETSEEGHSLPVSQF